MDCGKCGVANLERAKFCRSCGADMSYERDRGKIEQPFFMILSCIMLLTILASLVYYAIEVNKTDEKLDKGITYIYNEM